MVLVETRIWRISEEKNAPIYGDGRQCKRDPLAPAKRRYFVNDVRVLRPLQIQTTSRETLSMTEDEEEESI